MTCSWVGVGPNTDWLFKLNQTNYNEKLKNWSHWWRTNEADSTHNNQEELKGEHRLQTWGRGRNNDGQAWEDEKQVEDIRTIRWVWQERTINNTEHDY